MFRLAQHFACDRRGVAFPEGQELQQVGNRIAFGPSEVDVRDVARAISDVQQERRDRVWNGRALAPQHAKAVLADPGDVQDLAKLRGIAWLNLEKDYRVAGRQMVRFARLTQLVFVLLFVAVSRTVRDDVDGAFAADLLQ